MNSIGVCFMERTTSVQVITGILIKLYWEFNLIRPGF